MSTTGPSCEQHTDHLAELDLGTMTGRERAETLAHVETCSRCADEVEELSRAADELLLVSPRTEPPPGFEVRLFEQLGITVQRRRIARLPVLFGNLSRRARAVVVAAAGASVALAGTGVGLIVTSGAPAATVSRGTQAVQATLLGLHGQDFGRVVASPGSPSWIFMVVESQGFSGRLDCEVVLAGGKTLWLGTFSVVKGYGTWSSPLSATIGQVRATRLVDRSGQVVATATFAA